MTKKYEDQRKERMRLTEVVREMENDIKILLEGGRNFFQIRDLMGKLNKGLNTLDESAATNNRGAQVIKGVLQNLEDMELAQIEMRERRSKKKKKATPTAASPSGQEKVGGMQRGFQGASKKPEAP